MNQRIEFPEFDRVDVRRGIRPVNARQSLYSKRMDNAWRAEYRKYYTALRITSARTKYLNRLVIYLKRASNNIILVKDKTLERS